MEDKNVEKYFSFLSHLTKDDLEQLKEILMEALNPLLTYDQAAELLGKSKNALTAKVSRSSIKPVRLPPMLRYSDVKLIKDKKV